MKEKKTNIEKNEEFHRGVRGIQGGSRNHIAKFLSVSRPDFDLANSDYRWFGFRLVIQKRKNG